MTEEAIYVHEGHMVDYTPSAKVAAGDVVVQGALVGIAIKDIAANALGALAVTGVFDVAKSVASGSAITAGTNLYWDDSNNVATATASTHKYLGKCVAGVADAATTVRVLIGQLGLQ